MSLSKEIKMRYCSLFTNQYFLSCMLALKQQRMIFDLLCAKYFNYILKQATSQKRQIVKDKGN